jgi:hypothetical protein
MYFILEINNVIFNIYLKLEGSIVQLYKLSLLSNNCKLKAFKEGAIVGIYYVDNNKILYKTKTDNEIVINELKDIPFELMSEINTNKEENNVPEKKPENIYTRKPYNNRPKHISSDINVQLPPINTEILISSNNEEPEDLEELKKRIDELNKLKEQEIDDLENLNENLHEYENKIIQEKYNVDADKNKLKRDKEKWEEFKNIFNADKKIYRIMREQFDRSEIDEIPELFEKKYPIFKLLDENNLLDTSSEIYEYIKLLPEDDSVYIPKDIVLEGLFNKDNVVSSISLTELKETNIETTIETDEES